MQLREIMTAGVVADVIEGALPDFHLHERGWSGTLPVP